MFGLNQGEIIIIAIIILVIFGGKKLPEFSKGLTEAIKEFKKSVNKDDKRSE